MRMEQLLLVAHGQGPDLAAAVLAGLRDGGSRLRLKAAVLRRLPPRRTPRRRSHAPWLIAASVLLALGGLLLATVPHATPPAAPAVAVIEPAVPSTPALATVTTADPGSGLRVGQAVAPGDTLKLAVGGGATVAGPGWQLTLEPGCAVLCRSPEALTLLSGAVQAEVAPRQPGHPLVFTTAQTQATVIGTKLRLEQAAGRTLLDVSHGVVRLGAGGATVDTTAGGTALAAAGMPPRALSWKPLFTPDLADWDQPYGEWRWDQERGHLIGTGRARLLSRVPHGDLELRCRLRISGAECAEVQLGDYNWFVSVPQSAEWVQVRLAQHGGELYATLDGRPVALEPGDGKPARAGGISFYTRGGTVTIAEAFFAE
jgi:hypothetical protein